MRKCWLKNFFLILFSSLFPFFVLSEVGVGIGIGKMEIEKPLRAGGIYQLPALPVFNPGQEEKEYQVSIGYHQDQEKDPKMGLQPAKEWFSFQPERFYLAPGELKRVKIVLTLPIKAKAGNYFAYLEVQPIEKSKGQTKITIASANRLYFSVAQTNIFEGIYYRFLSLLSQFFGRLKNLSSTGNFAHRLLKWN